MVHVRQANLMALPRSGKGADGLKAGRQRPDWGDHEAHRELQAEDVVVLCGLAARPDLNGRVAVVVELPLGQQGGKGGAGAAAAAADDR